MVEATSRKRRSPPAHKGKSNVRPVLEPLEDRTLPSAFPFVLSINRTAPIGPATAGSTVKYTVTFSETVTGVAAADFQLALGGPVTAKVTQVTPVSGAVYTVTVSSITGTGTLGLNLVDLGGIHDLAGKPLTQQNAPAAFQAQQTVATGSQPRPVAVGDVNGDGKPDLVVDNFNSNSVSMLLGNGDGTFQAQKTFATGIGPTALVIADVNGDGKLDLVIVDQTSFGVTVLLGNGNGTFHGQKTFSTGRDPTCVAVGDVNGDGTPDLVVTNTYMPGTVGLLLGNGNGTFQAEKTFTVGNGPLSVAIADVNGDGNPDLVVTSFYSARAAVLLGNGNGTFQAQKTFAVVGMPRSVVVADVNGDGQPDLVVTGYYNSAASVLLGNGNGTFQAQQTFVIFDKPTSLTVSDVNGDGKPDLVVTAYGSGAKASVLLGNGDGSFQAQQTFATGNEPFSVAIADVNGDGKPDLVVANTADNTMTVLLGAGNGDFTGQTYVVGTFFDISAPASATAGNPFSLTVTAEDFANTIVTGFTGTVHFTASDSAASTVLPADYTFVPNDNGQHVFTSGVELVTAGSQTVTATATNSGSTNGTSNAIAVSPAAASHISLGTVARATAGTAFNVSVSALDPFNNTATSYNGSVHFTSTDGAATLPADSTLTNGTGTVSFTFNTAGNQTLTATDTVTSSIVGTSSTISVSAAAATHIAFTAPADVTAGLAFTVTVTALDTFDNTATGYQGTLHFTSNDAQAALPADATLSGGVGTFSVTLKTPGNQTLTAADTATSSITGTSSTITAKISITSFAVSAPSNISAGNPFIFTVTALDQSSHVTTNYNGTVHFSSSDILALLAADATLTNGVGQFAAALRTGGIQTVTVSDTVTTTITGSATVSVNAPAATHFAVSALTTTAAGNAFVFNVVAEDQSNNIAAGYAGTVHISSSDTLAILSSSIATVTGGVGFFGVSLKTAGSQTITATDSTTSSINGTSGPVSVSPATVNHFAVSALTSAVTGSAFAFTVTAEDAFNNVVPTYQGTVKFTSTDAKAVLPANATLERPALASSMPRLTPLAIKRSAPPTTPSAPSPARATPSSRPACASRP